MAFFKNFQDSLSSVSVSSILDSVSSTVSNTVEGVKTAVSDVTYTVSDHLTEQVSTIINKKQGEDEDKGKRDEGEAPLEMESDSKAGAGERINSKRHAFTDEEEERREREKQEQARKNEEEQWEWCYAPSKGWYRKRRDPNQSNTSVEKQETKEGRTEASGHLSSSYKDMNLKEVAAVRMENNEGVPEDTISKTSNETVNCEDTRTEQRRNSNSDQTNGNAHDEHARDEPAQDGHGDMQDRHVQNRDDTQSNERRNSTKQTQNTGIHLSRPFVQPFVYFSVCLSACLSFCLPCVCWVANPSMFCTCLSLFPSTCLSVHLPVPGCITIYLSTHVSTCILVCLFV